MDINPLLLLQFTNQENDRVIEGLRGLPHDVLLNSIRQDYLSPFGLMVHLMSADRVWLSRWQGIYPPMLITPDDVPTLDALIAMWQPLRGELHDYVAEVAGDASATITYRTTQGVDHTAPWWMLFLHVINHNTEHRSQVALFLATRGIDVGNLDLIDYLRTVK